MRNSKGQKVEGKVNIRDSYKLYRKLCDTPVSITIYVNLVNEFMKFIAELIVEGESISLPMRMGTLAVIGRKHKLELDDDGNIKKGLSPNWGETKKLWEKCPECAARKELIYYLNEHTNNVRYRVLWSKRGVLTGNKTLYSFQVAKENKRLVKEQIFAGREYFVLKPKEFYDGSNRNQTESQVQQQEGAFRPT